MCIFKFVTLTDFAFVTRIEDPVQVLKDDWLIWIPQKVKVESETHRRTYLPTLSTLFFWSAVKSQLKRYVNVRLVYYYYYDVDCKISQSTIL